MRVGPQPSSPLVRNPLWPDVTWANDRARGAGSTEGLLLMSDNCAFNPGLQVQQGALQEDGDGSQPDQGVRLALPGVTPSSLTLAGATTTHAAVKAGVVSWMQSAPDGSSSWVTAFVGICRWMVERFGWQAPSR